MEINNIYHIGDTVIHPRTKQPVTIMGIHAHIFETTTHILYSLGIGDTVFEKSVVEAQRIPDGA